MPYLTPERPEKVSAPSLKSSKQRGERLVCLTAYDYPTARLLDEAGIDVILVGDSLGNVVLGYGNTVPVTLEEILIHLKAVRRAVQRALLVADMPYGTFHTGEDDAVRNALRLVKEGGAEAVKLEGGHKRVQLVKRLVDEEISVMGHIGLTPQSINQLGAYRVQGKTPLTAQQLIDDAKALEDAGAFAVVLEVVPREIAKIITESISIPTIGIGAGAALRHSGAGPARHAWSIFRQDRALRSPVCEPERSDHRRCHQVRGRCAKRHLSIDSRIVRVAGGDGGSTRDRKSHERLKGREVLKPTPQNYGDHQPPSAHEFRRAQNPS